VPDIRHNDGRSRVLAEPADGERVHRVAMEATGVYWKPVWNILSDGKFELLVANGLATSLSQDAPLRSRDDFRPVSRAERKRRQTPPCNSCPSCEKRRNRTEAFGFDVDRAAIEVTGTETLVFGAVLQHVVDCGEQRSRHGADRFLRAVPDAQAIALPLPRSPSSAFRSSSGRSQKPHETSRTARVLTR
jgi:hypothetical protein